jgi:hypothetical protein
MERGCTRRRSFLPPYLLKAINFILIINHITITHVLFISVCLFVCFGYLSICLFVYPFILLVCLLICLFCIDVKTVLEVCFKSHPGVTMLVMASEFAVPESFVSNCRAKLAVHMEELLATHGAALTQLHASQNSEEKEDVVDEGADLVEVDVAKRVVSPKSGNKAKGGKKGKKAKDNSDDDDERPITLPVKSRQSSAAMSKSVRLQKLESELVMRFEAGFSSVLRRVNSKSVDLELVYVLFILF